MLDSPGGETIPQVLTEEDDVIGVEARANEVGAPLLPLAFLVPLLLLVFFFLLLVLLLLMLATST